jgi:hypothetical protein
MNEPDTSVTADSGDDVERTDDIGALKAEAKKRRLALRAAQATIEQQAARIDAADQREVMRLAEDRMANPADLLLVATLDDMRGEDGALDVDRANATIESVLGDREHWRKPAEQSEPEPAPFPAVHQGARQSQPPEPPSFGDQLKGLGRR